MRLRPETDPLAERVRRPHYIDIYFRGRPLDTSVITEVAVGNYDDLRQLVLEAMEANELDEVKVPYRYVVRVYEHKVGRSGLPRKGRRILDYVPRGEEGGHGGYGHAA